jgi:hypothetical protein
VAVVIVAAVAAETTKTSAAIAMARLTDNNQPKVVEKEMARTTRTMGEDGNNNGQGR